MLRQTNGNDGEKNKMLNYFSTRDGQSKCHHVKLEYSLTQICIEVFFLESNQTVMLVSSIDSSFLRHLFRNLTIGKGIKGNQHENKET